jgi:hypothetical protein
VVVLFELFVGSTVETHEELIASVVSRDTLHVVTSVSACAIMVGAFVVTAGINGNEF